MSALLLFLYFSLLQAQADDDIFHPPSTAIQNTKYADDCGGVSEDLRGDMPPIDNQLQSNWCTTFAAKALIEYSTHVANPGDTYSNLPSAVDLNSWDSRRVLRGKFLGVDDSSSIYTVLEGAQDKGELFSEQNLPFDQSLFDQSRMLRRLGSYYADEAQYIGQMSCRNQNIEDSSVERLFPLAAQLLDKSNSEESFLNSMDTSYTLTHVSPPAGAVREKIMPPYDIRTFAAVSGDKLMEELQNNLRDKKPTALGLCGDQLIQDPKLLGNFVPPPKTNTCGAHAVVVVGLKKIDGTCQVEIRNSWGTQWPTAADGGYAWVPVKELLPILETNQNNIDLISITSRQSNSPVQNQIVEPDFKYTGQTWQLHMTGQGHMQQQSGVVLDGTFQEGALNGQGSMTEADGSVFSGTFQNGQFISGTYRGTINTWLGPKYYVGPLVNGKTTSDGKFTDVSQNTKNTNISK